MYVRLEIAYKVTAHIQTKHMNGIATDFYLMSKILWMWTAFPMDPIQMLGAEDANNRKNSFLIDSIISIHMD